MLSPTPFSLICAVLLCLPLTIIFTITSPTTTITTTIPTQISQSLKLTKTYQKINLISLPKSLPLDDDSLFHLAARVKSRPPRSDHPKIAFLFLTTTPLPFSPLWECFFNQTPKTHFSIYVHADPRFPYDPPFSGIFAHRVIPSQPAQRFTSTLISATRRLLAHALLDDPKNAMFALLSPSCIPIRSFNFTYQTLARSKKSFIEILDNEIGAYDRWAARGEDAMLPQVKLEEFRIGSQFWILKRKHARVVVGDHRLWSKFKLPCQRWDTCYPEENYFPTLLNMREPGGCVPATLTHVDWRGRFDGHPRTYKASDLGPHLITTLRNDRPKYGDEKESGNGSAWSLTERRDPFLFARKFPPDAIGPLMSMANDVIFKD
ncbi:hypothetical protein PRUPE_7G026200 [Prunus persica]|uniref:Uncharacterized protein n=1 Tax=Prunus persica TaxID=3760 RepID=M5W788_PRUPE|nr:uncharacterized protein LOC18769993 [Prunus persica]ONH94681.1 hypothetical protein PRUPE_7G026200 [Prunus persica]